MKTLDGGRLGMSAQALGIAQGCLEESIKYAKERKQFGQPIAKFQAISFMIAEMATEIEAARQLIYSTAVRKDAGDQTEKHVICRRATARIHPFPEYAKALLPTECVGSNALLDGEHVRTAFSPGGRG